MKTRAVLCIHHNTTSTFFSKEEERADDEQQLRAGLCQLVPVLETNREGNSIPGSHIDSLRCSTRSRRRGVCQLYSTTSTIISISTAAFAGS